MKKMKSSKKIIEIELIISITASLITFYKNQSVYESIFIFIVVYFIEFSISLVIPNVKKHKYSQKLLNSGINIVDKMTGEEFEDFLLAHFENLGYKGTTTSKTNDYGADLILNKGNGRIVVQAKRWIKKVGVEAIQQVIGAKSYYKADKCIVITNNYFTPNAKSLATKSNVELWDRKKLIEIMNISSGREIANKATNEVDISKRVICPKCGAEMIIKSGHYSKFYGCSRYPKCKGIRKYKI